MAHPNFMEKTFAGGSKTMKFMNISSSKVFHCMSFGMPQNWETELEIENGVLFDSTRSFSDSETRES